MTESLVRDYYTGQVRKEWRRLVRDAYHRLEFETTLHFLEKYLPPNGLILDAGGGPGRYTLELARRGYQVVLLDMTPANLEFASRQLKRAKLPKRAVGLVEGSIVDLSQFTDGMFDAVICLGGPLSHVLGAEKRDGAISELISCRQERRSGLRLRDGASKFIDHRADPVPTRDRNAAFHPDPRQRATMRVAPASLPVTFSCPKSFKMPSATKV